MSNMKRYLKYIIWIVLFYLFTNILIDITIKHKYYKDEEKENTVVTEETERK